LGNARGLELIHHLLEAGRTATLSALTDEALAVFGDLAGASLGLDDSEAIAGRWHAGEAEHFDRSRRSGRLDLPALVIDERSDTGKFGTGDKDVADGERAALHKHGRHRTPAAIQLGLDDEALGAAVMRHPDLKHLGLQQNGFE